MTSPGGDDEAHVVYVFVGGTEDVESDQDSRGDDNPTISADDIAEWFAIVAPVEYIKLQYDATSKRSCFAVRFRAAQAARIVCENLDGVKLKNCPIHIESRLYAKNEGSDKDGDAASSGVDGARRQDTATVEVIPGLPHNHLVPSNLRVDPELARLVPTSKEGLPPDAATQEEFEKSAAALRSRQQALVELMRSVEAAKARIAAVDEEVRRLRTNGSPNSASSVGLAINAKEHSHAVSSVLSSSLAVRTAAPIPIARCSPSACVSAISERFGPITWCHCLVTSLSTTEEAFFLSVAFMMEQDMAAFMRHVQVNDTAAEPSAKRARKHTGTSPHVEDGVDAVLRSVEWLSQ